MKNKRKVTNSVLALIICHVLLVSCNWNEQHSLKEVENIAFDLGSLDSIKDFSSNKNHPVQKVENIGFDLYTKLRRLKKNKINDISISTVRTEKHIIQRFGIGTTYKIVNHYENGVSQRYFLFYSEDGEIYRITGF